MSTGTPLLARGWNGLRGWLQGSRPQAPSAAQIPVRVRRIAHETADIKSFELVGADGGALPAWSAGAHVDVQVPGAPVRQYSLCGVPGARDAYRVAVKHAPGSRGGSRAMHERVAVGDTLAIGNPRNHFALAAGACHHVLLAAGIGITPLLAMAQELQLQGASYELHYFTRSAAETAFRQELSSGPCAGRVMFHHAVGDRLRGLLAQRLLPCPAGHHLYICGPRRFTDAVREVTAGTWPSEAVHVESFGGGAAAAGAATDAFEVRLQRSRRTIAVGAGTSIVDALSASGIEVATSCREGVCGTCLTRVLAGTPDHRDAFLSERERRAGDRILPCVSRAKCGPLVLDL